MSATTERRFMPTGVDIADAEGYVGEGPEPEIVEKTANDTLARYDRFFDSMPSNLAQVFLKDLSDKVWEVNHHQGYVHIAYRHKASDTMSMTLRAPNSNDYPFEVMSYEESMIEKNTNWAIGKITGITAQLLGPFETAQSKSEEERQTEDLLEKFKAGHREHGAKLITERAKADQATPTQSDQSQE